MKTIAGRCRPAITCNLNVTRHCVRCFNAAKTVQWTSTATGPITRMDSATCLANSGLVCEWSNSQFTLIVKNFHRKEITIQSTAKDVSKMAFMCYGRTIAAYLL